MTQQLLIKSKTAAWFLTQSQNKLLNTSDFSADEWVAANCLVTTGQADPDGGTTASIITATAANGTILQEVDLGGESLNRVFSIYLKRSVGTGDISITANGTTYSVEVIDATWTRYDTDIVATGTVTVGVKIATSGDAVFVAYPQYEDGIVPSTYDANTTSIYAVTQIVDSDYPANTTRGCTFMSGRFFVMSKKGEIYQSDLQNAASWSALGFIQSQADPSDGVYITKTKNYIVALKEWSTEFFYDAANPTASILAPIQNAAIQIGCASDGSVQDVGMAIVFMGQTRNGFGRSIYLLTGQEVTKISALNVDKILDSSDLSNVRSWAAQVGSHLLYAVTLVDVSVTLVYDFSTQQWSFFTYLTTSGAAKTITAISATGTATIAAHGLADGDIIQITSTNDDFNGWHIVTDVATNTFQIQATGTAFSGSGSAQKYAETYFPVVASVRAAGRQYMQDASSGALYEFSQEAYKDNVGAIAARIRTPKADSGSVKPKFMASAELIGDKIDSNACIRYTDDDYVTYSKFKPVDLNANRSRVRRLGNYNRRSFEILHVGDALFRMEAIEID